MYSQDHHNKNASSGHENHVCHKCGWPFPNPHPSAKHRRAHKKLCGTIEGYKLVESNTEDPHLAVSDDDHPSDDDFRTPSPKIGKRKVVELGSGGGGVGEKSNRSEGEVFADAVMEFSDSGVSPATEENIRELNKDVEKVGNESQLLKVDATAGSANDPIWSSQTSKSKAIETARDESEKSFNDRGVETSSVGSSGIIGLQFDDSPVKFETPTDTSTKAINADVDSGIEKEPDIPGKEDAEIDKTPTDFIDPHAKASRELSKQDSVIPEAAPERESELEADKEKSLGFATLVNVEYGSVTTDYKLQMGDGKTSEHLSTDEIIEGKKYENDEVKATVAKHDVTPSVKPLEHIEESIADHGVDVSGQSKIVGVFGAPEEGIEDVKEGNLSEAHKDTKHSFLLPESLPVMDNVEHMIEDFKDYNILKSSFPLDLGSAEVIGLVQVDDEATVAEGHSDSHSGDVSRNIESSSAELSALEHHADAKGDEKPNDGKADIPGLIEESGEASRCRGLESPSDAPRTEAQNIQPHSIDSELSQKAHSENATMDQSDIKSAVIGEEVTQTINLIEGENADHNETTNSEKGVTAINESSNSEDELLNKNSASVEVRHTIEGVNNSLSGGSRDEVEDKLENQHDGVSAFDISVASSSRTDSLEGNWGSVSVRYNGYC